MSENKLKTAILGLDDRGQLLLEAACQIDYFQIQAVADKDAELAKTAAAQYQCTAYDDYRQLIMQNQLDCLLVAAAIYTCDEYIRMAMKKKFNILKLTPPARDFEEAAKFVRLAEEQNINFAVAAPQRFAKSFLALRQFLQKGQPPIKSGVYLITAFCSTGDRRRPGWQSDPKLAGGGVLLHNCYELIDQIICNFGTPQQVYCIKTNTAGDRQQRLCLTEDTAVATMRFAEASIGNLIAGRPFQPSQEFLKVYGKNKILTVTKNRFTVSDALGRPKEESEYDDDDLACMTEQLKNFALSILQPDENKLCSSGSENLHNMAVIESAYVSAHTGFPEQPAKILEMAQVEPTNIWQADI